MGKPAEVSLDDSVYDQASRYGLSIDDYLNGSSNTYTEGSDLPDTFSKGNPFFTGINQPTQAKTQSTLTSRPFRWEGNNNSLRNAYQKSHSAFQSKYGKTNDFEQYATWQGPQIKPEYQTHSNGLSFLGTPTYWQDNNKNQLYEDEFDDSFMGNPNQPMSTGQAGNTPTPSTNQSSGSQYDVEAYLSGLNPAVVPPWLRRLRSQSGNSPPPMSPSAGGAPPQWARPQQQAYAPSSEPQRGGINPMYSGAGRDYTPQEQTYDVDGQQTGGSRYDTDGLYTGSWESGLEDNWSY